MIEGFFFAFVGVGIWAENDCEWDVFVGAWRFSDSYGEGIIFFIQMYFFSNVVCFEGVEGVGWVDGGVDIKTRVVFEERVLAEMVVFGEFESDNPRNGFVFFVVDFLLFDALAVKVENSGAVGFEFIEFFIFHVLEEAVFYFGFFVECGFELVDVDVERVVVFGRERFIRIYVNF
ncbi:MAG: hypothetical protein A2912_02390 [Candidatus Buchananbacteria bacterium RIFCSPLOWO2_01_FULL_40_23b]|uniref:Uncharacterized protein n=1 Tax=Candidatus Buchananbacteria bacterium RIFCSPLOWO2_01_FULL_40_23b TaxID=1797544 RepID=A0A1G1YNF6_9BACT|nr:MAG: hypothetical protein A2912_02390 [Candidatus Buchananbacteria bacterium RIFCSPLOWO2_01_FULL_40_23b]